MRTETAGGSGGSDAAADSSRSVASPPATGIRGLLSVTLYAVVGAVFVTLASGVASAHGGALRDASGSDLAVPAWLFLLTGGGVVGASFLLASFATDRAFVRGVHERHVRVPMPGRAIRWLARLAGTVGLAWVVISGLFGPSDPTANAGILLVWVGWWAGLTMAVYLVGNVWPAVDPLRPVLRWLPNGAVPYPARLGAWPSVVALLALVWVEITSPLSADGPLLAWTVLGYVVVTAAGALLVGVESWYRFVDPVAGVFRQFGRVAPIQREGSRLALRLPGAAITDERRVERGETAFVVVLLWATTYDGLVATSAWADLLRPAVRAGVPPLLGYAVGLLGGATLFLGAYALSIRLARRTAPTYLAAPHLARTFGGALLPIAAGYHLAHFLGYFLSLAPALGAALANPLAPHAASRLVLPPEFAAVSVGSVLVGHLLAIWIAHAVAFRVFPGRLQAVRSQYPLTLVMIAYTMTSLWIVSSPETTPPFL